ncbi:ParB/RepB/Spo0J family partition protein [Candidatus Kaiserbacteria bacterium]|nr:ParB/RepB/Spo0J family partition protein [Candidatus Kaiserbacteria bacterium]
MVNPSPYRNDSIFWVEVDRIKPNPFQPRRVFDEVALASLAESIRQYGVLQPLTVTRKEIEKPGEGIFVEYELIAGERRLRASKLAGIQQVPVVIRTSEDSDKMKLEMAIVENLQREDLNPVDRAIAFQRLVNEFGLKHTEIGARVGKSREYVSNTLRILMLPKEMLDSLAAGEISEGHTRPLLMLIERPEEQATLFKEIIIRRMTVRDAEQTARRIAVERSRKNDLTPELLLIERELTEKLGTRVRIEKREQGGGKVSIDFFSADDLVQLRAILAQAEAQAQAAAAAPAASAAAPLEGDIAPIEVAEQQEAPADAPLAAVAKPEERDDLYSISSFTV